MKNRYFPFALLLVVVPALLLFASCRQKKGEVITRRIQYDVNIKSPHPDYDWWIQNIAGPQRENLVRMILQGAVSGKYKAYDYFYQPLSKEAVARILNDTLSIKIREATPPYGLKDTFLVTRIGIKDIQRLRFMETWTVNPDNLQFSKTIQGIAPVARRLDAAGNVRWQPLFWIFPNKKVLQGLQQTP